MTALSIILNIVLILVSLVLVAVVLMQQGQRQGLGAIAGGAETFLGKGKAKGLDAKLAKITKIAAIAFIVLAIACTIVVSHIEKDDVELLDDTAYINLTEEDVAALESGEAHLHEDGSVHYGDDTEDAAADTEEAAVETEDTAADTEVAAVETEDAATDTEEAPAAE